MQFSPHKPHNVPERFAASVAKVCTTASAVTSIEILSIVDLSESIDKTNQGGARALGVVPRRSGRSVGGFGTDDCAP